MIAVCVLAETQILVSEDGVEIVCELTGTGQDVSDQLSNCLFLGSLGAFVVFPC